MSTTSINISLPKNLKDKVEEAISSGHFSNSSDYIRHLIRQDLSKKEEEQELKSLLKAGLESGVSEKSITEVFSDLRGYIKSKAS